MLQAGPPFLHYYFAVVLHSCMILPPVGHSSYHEYHYFQLTRQTSCVLNFYCTFNVFIWISLVQASIPVLLIRWSYPCARHESVRECKNTDPPILKLDSRWKCLFSFTFAPLYTGGKTARYTSSRRLVGPGCFAEEIISFNFMCPCILNHEGEEITNQMQKRWCFYWWLNMFRASLCPSSGEQDKADKSPTVYSTGRAAADQRRWGSSVCTCWGWFQSWNHPQQVPTELPHLL
jgi:hypothetical protein